MTANALVFIPESGSEIGMGHVYRLISMAQMLQTAHSISFLVSTDQALTVVRQSGFECALSSFERNELVDRVKCGTIAVLDGYHFTTDLFNGFRKKNIQTIYLDDFAESFPPADIILNTADLQSAPEIPAIFSQYVYGHSYMLLRKEFLSLSGQTKDIHQSVGKFFICLGATDPNKLTITLINSILSLHSKAANLLPEPAFTILTSSLNPQLSRLAALPNTALLTDATADKIVEAISQHDSAIVSASNIAQECIAIGMPLACVQTAGNQHNLYTSLTANKLCYPLGDAATFLQELEVFIRKLGDSDFRQSQLQNQRKWIDGKSGERIRSLVRFSCHEQKAVIGITVGPESRGQRLAARSLVLACGRYFRHFPHHTVEAYIKTGNTASFKAFRSAGFHSARTTEVNGIPALLLTKTST